MATRVVVRKNNYHDSMVLVQINHCVLEIGGITKSGILMGTENNKVLFKDYGFADKCIDEAGVGDLIICLEASSESVLDEATVVIEKLLTEKIARKSRRNNFSSIQTASETIPGVNLAVISVPGQFAAREATKALEKNMHVLVFSDNVSLEDEVKLKQLAISKNLLLMGPDCGTAIIDGIGFGFANSVQKGPIGIVGASGTGIQELCVLLEEFGNVGISHAVGVGGRDLTDAVGGMSSLKGLELLEND
ncbi:MAG: FdrA family protein, partial [Syntrophaceae bacterium]|nr:FdrA family protein [Syntrophaceae bacterium]